MLAMQCALLPARASAPGRHLWPPGEGLPAYSPGTLRLRLQLHPASSHGFVLSTPGSQSLSAGLAGRRGALESLSHIASLRASPAQSLKGPKRRFPAWSGTRSTRPQRLRPFASCCRALSAGLPLPISVRLLFHVAGLLQKPLPLWLIHRQSERHLLEDAAYSHLVSQRDQGWLSYSHKFEHQQTPPPRPRLHPPAGDTLTCSK